MRVINKPYSYYKHVNVSLSHFDAFDCISNKASHIAVRHNCCLISLMPNTLQQQECTLTPEVFPRVSILSWQCIIQWRGNLLRKSKWRATGHTRIWFSAAKKGNISKNLSECLEGNTALLCSGAVPPSRIWLFAEFSLIQLWKPCLCLQCEDIDA